MKLAGWKPLGGSSQRYINPQGQEVSRRTYLNAQARTVGYQTYSQFRREATRRTTSGAPSLYHTLIQHSNSPTEIKQLGSEFNRVWADMTINKQATGKRKSFTRQEWLTIMYTTDIDDDDPLWDLY